jgi:hypothetical protein
LILEDLASGIERILELGTDTRFVVMYSELQPLTNHKIPGANCHRVGLLVPLLKATDTTRIIHVLPTADSIEFDEAVVSSIW